jgi:hypothetical protein
MAVRFRGRLVPNIQWDPFEPLEVRFIAPSRADGVTLLIKELDTYKDGGGRQISEGSQDDLLATFKGKIRRKRFQVESHVNQSKDAGLPKVKIKFQGSPQIYEIPIITELTEVEDTNWEIAFTVQYMGQEDYNSPVAFLTQARGSAFIVDNTMGDLDDYEGHANLIRHLFAARKMEAKIIRGIKSNKKKYYAYYNQAETTEFRAGFDLNEFKSRAKDFNFIYFNCHGNIDLESGSSDLQDVPCLLCETRFAHHAFTECQKDDPCNTVDKHGYYLYKLRTNPNVNIRIGGTGTQQLRDIMEAHDRLTKLVGPFVQWNEFEREFGNANKDNPNLLSSGPAGTPPYRLSLPNRFNFPTLSAFLPAPPNRPDFRDNNIEVLINIRWQEPDSPYLHHSNAEDVPGVPVICFMGEAGMMSDEESATPAAGAPMTFATPGGDLKAFGDKPNLNIAAGPGYVELRWDKAPGAKSYDIFRATRPGVTEANSRTFTREVSKHRLNPTTFSDNTVKNGTTYYYKVRARRGGGDLSPSVWGGLGDLGKIKIIYPGCCLAGRKEVMAKAALKAGIKYYIGHQVVTGSTAEHLINEFWRRWLRGGAILRNVISVYNRVVAKNNGYINTRPVIYYIDTERRVKYWRPGMSIPDPNVIKLD